jgi:glycosyltransferase involved in cell wall biosynthesis
MYEADPGGSSIPEATVVVCTRNRSSALDRCLASIAAIDGIDDADVLVVDNGSTDGTQDVIERWAGQLPSMRSVHEPRTGLSHARNTALAVARGELVAFLDDDVLVQPTWFDAVLAAYRRWPDLAGLAGRIELSWPTGRPSWLSASRDVWFARLELGPDPRLLGDKEFPVGANMSVRRDIANAVGGFDPDLGYSGARLLGNEELEFFTRVRRAGHALGYEPAASVVHVVEGRRLTRRYLWRRIYSQGRSDVRSTVQPNSDSRKALLGIVRVALSRALVRNWRNDIRRSFPTHTGRSEWVDVVAGRAKQLGIAREAARITLTHR